MQAAHNPDYHPSRYAEKKNHVYYELDSAHKSKQEVHKQCK